MSMTFAATSLAKLRRARAAWASESGFTLVEALVASVLSVIIGLALFAMIEFSFRQTYNVSERVNANQRGRIALEQILLRLHSSCVAVSAVPVLAESSGTSLSILSKEGTQAYFSSMTKHRIYLSGTTLYDATYNSSGGIAPHWTFPSTASSTRTLLTNVSQSGSTPIFQYYKYESGGTLSSTAQTTPLTEPEAKSTAAIAVAFTVAPEFTTRSSGPTRSVELSDTTLLRFDPSTTTGQNTPCT
jgi:type II secretory pathway pseudopilin PulG